MMMLTMTATTILLSCVFYWVQSTGFCFVFLCCFDFDDKKHHWIFSVLVHSFSCCLFPNLPAFSLGQSLTEWSICWFVKLSQTRTHTHEKKQKPKWINDACDFLSKSFFFSSFSTLFLVFSVGCQRNTANRLNVVIFVRVNVSECAWVSMCWEMRSSVCCNYFVVQIQNDNELVSIWWF